MSKFVTLFALLLSLTAYAGTVPQEVKTVSDQFNTTMQVCPEKIWLSYNWQGLKVAYIYPSPKESWLWDVSTNLISRLDTSSLP